jgi:hypothetical protein
MISRNESARAQQRIENIMDQIRAYENGDQHSITCPYCAGINRDGVNFCCSMFAKASVAALERLRVEQSTEVVERVMERHGKN